MVKEARDPDLLYLILPMPTTMSVHPPRRDTPEPATTIAA